MSPSTVAIVNSQRGASQRCRMSVMVALSYRLRDTPEASGRRAAGCVQRIAGGVQGTGDALAARGS